MLHKRIGKCNRAGVHERRSSRRGVDFGGCSELWQARSRRPGGGPIDDSLRSCDRACCWWPSPVLRSRVSRPRVVPCCGRTATAQQKVSWRMPEVRSRQVNRREDNWLRPSGAFVDFGGSHSTNTALGVPQAANSCQSIVALVSLPVLRTVGLASMPSTLTDRHMRGWSVSGTTRPFGVGDIAIPRSLSPVHLSWERAANFLCRS